MQTLANMASLRYLVPEFVLVAVFVLIFLLDLSATLNKKKQGAVVAALGLVAYIVLTVQGLALPASKIFYGMIVIDPFTNFFRILCAATTLIVVYLSVESKEVQGTRAEYWALLIGVTIGMPMLAASSNLLMIYLTLELVSILSYVLVGHVHGARKSAEAALKYVLYGATASGVMIYGLSLIFGLTGTLDTMQIREFLVGSHIDRLPLLIALIMTLVGFGYKVAAVPFHMWAPDVYEGAPTPITAFLSVGPKAAGFAILLRFVYTAFTVPQDNVFVPLHSMDLGILFTVLAVLTMTLGNVVAIQQNNVKRFLAYSSIAHAGYMLMALASLSMDAVQAVVFYLIAYFIMNLGAFAVAIVVIDYSGSEDLNAYKGLGRRAGWGVGVALAMTLFMFSLTGLPPTVGFIGKFYLFAAVLKSKLYVLAIIGALNSVISLYYYARVVKYMFFDEPSDNKPFVLPGRTYQGALICLAVAILFFGLFWKSLALITESSANLLF